MIDCPIRPRFPSRLFGSLNWTNIKRHDQFVKLQGFAMRSKTNYSTTQSQAATDRSIRFRSNADMQSMLDLPNPHQGRLTLVPRGCLPLVGMLAGFSNASSSPSIPPCCPAYYYRDGRPQRRCTRSLQNILGRPTWVEILACPHYCVARNGMRHAHGSDLAFTTGMRTLSAPSTWSLGASSGPERIGRRGPCRHWRPPHLWQDEIAPP